MSNELTIASTFTVTRTSKAGKITERSVNRTITSGNKSERESLALAMLRAQISNNNFKHLLIDLCAMFPVEKLKASNIAVGADKSIMFVYKKNGMDTIDHFDTAKANKPMVMQYAKAILEVTDLATVAGKKLSWEKTVFVEELRKMVSNELTLQIKLADEACQADAEASRDADYQNEAEADAA